ncbi:MAG TPA: hypothetical protein VH418_07630 [Solirubrobacteraceae bacterium]
MKLRPGRHVRPEDGACVVELASMLAGESFSDHPQCVSPVIAAFLRGYNDGIGDFRRQDLYPVASEIVGSSAPAEVEAARLERCREWVRPLYRWRWTWRCATWLGSTVWVEEAGQRAALAARRDPAGSAHAAALAFAHELLRTGEGRTEAQSLRVPAAV